MVDLPLLEFVFVHLVNKSQLPITVILIDIIVSYVKSMLHDHLLSVYQVIQFHSVNADNCIASILI